MTSKSLQNPITLEMQSQKSLSSWSNWVCMFLLHLTSAAPNLPKKKVIVSVVSEAPRKAFVGGYRHKKTGVEYHHAFSQTERPKKTEAKEVLHADICLTPSRFCLGLLGRLRLPSCSKARCRAIESMGLKWLGSSVLAVSLCRIVQI